jgi:hypothetical protein
VRARELHEAGHVVVVMHLQIPVGHHRPTPVPSPAADDVDARRGERVGRAHHGADVVVVAEVLDGDVERVGPAHEIGGHRIAAPIPVRVHHIARVALREQIGVVPIVARPRRRPAGPRPHAHLARHRPFTRPGRVSLHIHGAMMPGPPDRRLVPRRMAGDMPHLLP